jgi:hypothetical protein
MLKSLMLAAAVLSLSTGVALAGEGNGNPFPFSGGSAIADVPTNVIQMTGQTPLMTKNPPNSVPNGNRAMATAIRQYAGVPVKSGDVLPTTGSQAPVQTANSLPRNFEDGTVPYEQAQSVQRYFAQQRAGQSQRAYTQAPQSIQTGTHG